MTPLGGKVVKGAFSYFLRQVVVWGLQFASSLLVLRWLVPTDFGYIAAVTLVLSIGQILAEGGLSIYLIQRPDEIDDAILSKVASLQLLVYGAVHAIATGVLIAACLMRRNGILLSLIWVALFSIPSGIIRANSFVSLERKLAFGKVAFIEVVESLVLVVLLVTLAYAGFGAWSVVAASVAKSLVGMGIAFSYSRWRFHPQWPHLTKEFRKGIRFGVNYHVPTLITTVRVAANPILIGGLLGMHAVGIADRAIYIAGLPLFFLGAVQQRVLFPYFARIQNDARLVRANFEKAFYLSAVVDKAFFLPLVLFAPQLIHTLAPKYSDALPLIYIAMIGNISLGALAFSFAPMLNGLGRADINAKLGAFSMVLSWILTWPLIKFYGVTGYAYVGLALWILGAGPLIIMLRRLICGVSLWRPLVVPLVAFLVSGGLVRTSLMFLPTVNLLGVGLLSLLAIGLYVLILGMLGGRDLFPLFKQLRAAWHRG